jgi:6-pyruvoyltetrahydropterin/6-carboxytetrahydropterin synthase
MRANYNVRMYRLTVETEFAAAHAIVMRGECEPLHGHNWRVTVTVAGRSLDEDGLLCDFHAVETSLRAAVERFHNRNLNETAPFDRVNPTAEHVARHLAEAVAGGIPAQDAARGVRVESVRVTEAPGCAATFFPRES